MSDWSDANRWRADPGDDGPLGYVCDDCWRWVALLSDEDDDCPHLRLHLPENLTPEEVAAAKERVRERLRVRLLQEHWELTDIDYGGGEVFLCVPRRDK